jgi:pilus assembly protein CpaB
MAIGLGWTWFSQKSQAAAASSAKVQVLVPIKNIPPRVDLQPGMFKIALCDPRELPPNYIPAERDITGHISVTDLPAEEPVRSVQVAERSKRELSYGLARGQRAVSVSVDLIQAAGDFVQPGNYVDILVAWNKDGHYQVRTLVQNVLVLAMGQATTPASEATSDAAGSTGRKSPSGRSDNQARRAETPCTLAVSPDQAQAILLADVSGEIRFALRGVDDKTLAGLAPMNSWDVIRAFPNDSRTSTELPPAPAPEPSPAPPPGYYTQQPPPGRTAQSVPVAPHTSADTVVVVRGEEREIVTPER